MGSTHTKRGVFAAALSTALVTSLVATAAAQDAEKVELTMLSDNTEGSVAWTESVVAAYQEKNPNVSITVEWAPGGADADNIMKTRLATGTMTDVFRYNSGSLFQALNPTETMVDLSGEAFRSPATIKDRALGFAWSLTTLASRSISSSRSMVWRSRSRWLPSLS